MSFTLFFFFFFLQEGKINKRKEKRLSREPSLIRVCQQEKGGLAMDE
jgi:hypothetical protein